MQNPVDNASLAKRRAHWNYKHHHVHSQDRGQRPDASRTFRVSGPLSPRTWGGKFTMRIRAALFIFAFAAAAAALASPGLRAQSAPGAADNKSQQRGMMSGGMPDLSGIWDADFRGAEGIR